MPAVERVFVDSNIVLYALDADQQKHETAWNLLFTKPYISLQVINECSNVLNRKRQWPAEDVAQTLERILQFVTSGSRYFCESFYGHPCPTSGKNYATANAFGGPSRPASLVAYPTRGMQHRYRNDSTRFRKACIFTTQKTLRENTCTIASGDYSTPVSQRGR